MLTGIQHANFIYGKTCLCTDSDRVSMWLYLWYLTIPQCLKWTRSKQTNKNCIEEKKNKQTFALINLMLLNITQQYHDQYFKCENEEERVEGACRWGWGFFWGEAGEWGEKKGGIVLLLYASNKKWRRWLTITTSREWPLISLLERDTLEASKNLNSWIVICIQIDD